MEVFYHMAKQKASAKGTRTRNWSCIIYPDSAPTNWIDILDEFHLEWVQSPLHEFDTNPTGEVKKPHWHILLMFGGVKTYEQVLEITDKLNCPRPEKCHNAKALVRYMAHLDNPEKYQYSINEIVPHGGVDVAEMLRPSSSERYSLISEMISYIREQGVTEFSDFLDYAAINHPDDWLPIILDHSTIVLDKYITSQRHKRGAE